MRRFGMASFLAVLAGCSNGGSGSTGNNPPPTPVAAVSVAPASASLLVGATRTLTASTTDASGNALTGRTVSWSSALPSIASVNASGVVTGVSAGGPVTITATSEGKSGTAQVTVTAPVVPVASVTVAPDSATLVVGATVTLTAAALDANGTTLTGRTISWTSSNSAIASVSASGVVTAVSAGGPVTITATSEGKNGTAQVTVTPPPPASITFTRSSSYLLVGDTLQVKVHVLDAMGHELSGQVPTWSASGAAASVDANGTVTAAAAGTALITAAVGSVNANFAVMVGVGSGVRVPELSAIDSLMITRMPALGLPGGAVAITRNGRLVLSRAYGYADSTTHRVAGTGDLWRIGSVSKPIVAIGVMKLVEQGLISLDDHPFTILTNLTPLPGQVEDSRLQNITVRDLLEHAGGWNPSRNVDDTVFAAMYRNGDTSATMLVRDGLGVALSGDPESHYAYTNFEYLVLARLIEHVTGQSYEAWTKANVLTPAGATDMRYGFTPLGHRFPAEVTYYDHRPTVTGFYGTGAWPDVSGAMEYSEAAGRWLASAVDMVKLLCTVDGQSNRPDLLMPSTIATMWARPPAPIWPATGYYYALGWEATPVTGGNTMSHAGGQDGGDSYFGLRPDGAGIGIVFNLTRGQEPGGQTLEGEVNTVLDHVTTWPSIDLFGN